MKTHNNQGLLFKVINEVYVYTFEKVKGYIDSLIDGDIEPKNEIEVRLINSFKKIEKKIESIKNLWNVL